MVKVEERDRKKHEPFVAFHVRASLIRSALRTNGMNIGTKFKNIIITNLTCYESELRIKRTSSYAPVFLIRTIGGKKTMTKIVRVRVLK